MHWEMRSILDKISIVIENRAREIEPITNVWTERGALKKMAHSKCNRLESRGKNLVARFGRRCRITCGACHAPRDDVAGPINLRPPTDIDHHGLADIKDQCWSLNGAASSK